MLDQDLRAAILRLREQGRGVRSIARALNISKNSVKRVLRDGHSQVPALQRDDPFAGHLDRIGQLYHECEGNRIRVVEKLRDEGVDIGYSTLTRFCRRYGIGVRPKRPAGIYHFEPGEEMQHDTSPHTVAVGGRRRPLQCASVVLCFSRMIFAQDYPRWSRFECRVFLTEAFLFFEALAHRAMIDNSSVILVGGSGANAVISPEMEAFARHFGFRFAAHELGDANRSARVERPFHYIEHNFYPGRSFASLKDLNAQLLQWCREVNDRPKRALGARPSERFAIEKPALLPLPAYVPPVYQLYIRRVDISGYVHLYTNRYSVPAQWLGRHLEVRETRDQVRIFEGPRLVAVHERQEPGANLRITLPEHREPWRWKRAPLPPTPEEKWLRSMAPEVSDLIEALRKRHGGRAVRAIRHLHRMALDYPTDVLTQAVADAQRYGMIDLNRIEAMILRRLAGDFFRLPVPTMEEEEHDDRGTGTAAEEPTDEPHASDPG
ncbi:MAG: IS21 family transposase [Actinobacteria bacterium]|nr:IS21 family transposase [Actinomycetota bacterium]